MLILMKPTAICPDDLTAGIKLMPLLQNFKITKLQWLHVDANIFYIFLFSRKDVSYHSGSTGVKWMKWIFALTACNIQMLGSLHTARTPCPCLTSSGFLMMEAEEKPGCGHIFHSHNLKHEEAPSGLWGWCHELFEDCGWVQTEIVGVCVKRYNWEGDRDRDMELVSVSPEQQSLRKDGEGSGFGHFLHPFQMIPITLWLIFMTVSQSVFHFFRNALWLQIFTRELDVNQLSCCSLSVW